MEKYQMSVPLPSKGINYMDDSLISDGEAAEGTVNISFRDGTPQTRRGMIKQALYTHTGETYPISKLGFHSVASEKRMLFAYYDTVASKYYAYQMNEDKNPVRRSLGEIASGKPCFLPLACALTGPVAYSEKVLELDGLAFKYFDETATLTAMPAYSPSAEEIAAYGTNTLTTTADEINKQKWAILDNNRVWLAGYDRFVRISHLGMAGAMPDYWPSTQIIKLQEPCTGLASFMGEVMLFTESSAAIVSGSTPVFSLDGSYTKTDLPGGYGCAQHESIATGDNAIYWASRDGVYRYRYLPTGQSIPECVSEFVTAEGSTRTIRKKLREISDWTKVFAVFHDHCYWLYVEDGEFLVFDAINATWTLYDYPRTFGAASFWQNRLFLAGSSMTTADAKHWVYEAEVTYDPTGVTLNGLSDAGEPISCVLKSKFFDFNAAANKKRFRRLYFTLYSELVSYDIDLTINMDNEETVLSSVISNKASRWGNDQPSDDETEREYAMTFGDTLNTNRTNLNYPIRLRHRGKKYNIQYQLSSNNLNNAWLLKAIVLVFKQKELK